MSLYNINKISIRKLELWSCCMEILQGQMLTVQVGRSYFEISIKEPFSLFGCCTAREFDKKKSYDKINRKHVHIDKTTNIKEDKGEDESDEEEEKKENNIVIRKDKYLNVIREENKDKEDTHANQNKEEKIVINDKKTAVEEYLVASKSIVQDS